MGAIIHLPVPIDPTGLDFLSLAAPTLPSLLLHFEFDETIKARNKELYIQKIALADTFLPRNADIVH